VDQLGPARSTARSRARVLSAPLLAARDRAQELLSAAEARAAALVAGAEQQAESIRAAARAAGREEGLADAQRVLVEVHRARTRLLDGAALRATASELALGMLAQVLGESWTADPGTWARACVRAAEPLRRARALTLWVAPSSAAAARAALSAELASGAVTLVEDATVAEPGCIAVSECGRLDARLSTVLAAFRATLLEEGTASGQPGSDSTAPWPAEATEDARPFGCGGGG
jgi:type III secretion protein L